MTRCTSCHHTACRCGTTRNNMATGGGSQGASTRLRRCPTCHSVACRCGVTAMTQTLSAVTHTVSLTVSELSWGRERAQQGAAESATVSPPRVGKWSGPTTPPRKETDTETATEKERMMRNAHPLPGLPPQQTSGGHASGSTPGKGRQRPPQQTSSSRASGSTPGKGRERPPQTTTISLLASGSAAGKERERRRPPQPTNRKPASRASIAAAAEASAVSAKLNASAAATSRRLPAAGRAARAAASRTAASSVPVSLLLDGVGAPPAASARSPPGKRRVRCRPQGTHRRGRGRGAPTRPPHQPGTQHRGGNPATAVSAPPAPPLSVGNGGSGSRSTLEQLQSFHAGEVAGEVAGEDTNEDVGTDRGEYAGEDNGASKGEEQADTHQLLHLDGPFMQAVVDVPRAAEPSYGMQDVHVHVQVQGHGQAAPLALPSTSLDSPRMRYTSTTASAVASTSAASPSQKTSSKKPSPTRNPNAYKVRHRAKFGDAHGSGSRVPDALIPFSDRHAARIARELQEDAEAAELQRVRAEKFAELKARRAKAASWSKKHRQKVRLFAISISVYLSLSQSTCAVLRSNLSVSIF